MTFNKMLHHEHKLVKQETETMSQR